MIEDINRASSGSINKPEKVDVIVIDNIETEGFITKLAYEYIRSLYTKAEIYLTEQPGWDIKSLSNDTLSVTRLINSIKIDKGQTIREFGNAKFLKIGGEDPMLSLPGQQPNADLTLLNYVLCQIRETGGWVIQR